MRRFFSTEKPYNCKIFRFIRLAESIGSGFHKMIKGWEQHYELKPVIEGDFDYYKITFPTTQKTTQKIIVLIGKSPEISRKELVEVIGLTEDGIKYHLKKMQKKGIIERIGPARGGYWEIK